MPGHEGVLDGEFDIGGVFQLRTIHASTVGDLRRSEFVMETEYGGARYAVLGGDQYFVDWGTYAFRSGLSYFASTEQPFIEMHFQLEGAVRATRDGLGITFDLQPGDTNLIAMPPGSARYALEVDSAGAVFEVQLAQAYFTDLAERYPHLFETFLEKMLRQEPFWLSRHPLPITPAMTAIIARIRRREAGGAAGSLFLESQILELLALQCEQRDRLRTTGRVNGRANGIAPADVEKLYAARDVLLARMADPPSLSELARVVGTNEFKLKRGFRELFGNSPYAFLRAHKLETARAYLLDTDLSIAEIAYQVGYSDPAHLTNAFRKKYGLRPSDLR